MYAAFLLELWIFKFDGGINESGPLSARCREGFPRTIRFIRFQEQRQRQVAQRPTDLSLEHNDPTRLDLVEGGTPLP
jgi:hypothetical protein